MKPYDTEEGFIMENQLRERLMEGEQLLWVGTPEPFETLDRTNKTGIVIGLVIKAVVALGLLAAYFIGMRGNGSVKPGIVIFILAFAAFAVLNPFIIAGRLRKKTIYGLTDRRVMRSGALDEAVPYDRIKRAALRTDADGHTSLLCGARAMKLKPRKWRSEADACFINDSDDPEAERVILFALPEDDELRALIKKYLPIA